MAYSNRMDATVTEPRAPTSRECEVFVREREADPLTHVGSVSAPTADVARKQATKLFGWAVEAHWLCPANETSRFQTAAIALGDSQAGSETEGYCDFGQQTPL